MPQLLLWIQTNKQKFKVRQPQRAARSKRPNTPSDGSKNNGIHTTNTIHPVLTYWLSLSPGFALIGLDVCVVMRFPCRGICMM